MSYDEEEDPMVMSDDLGDDESLDLSDETFLDDDKEEDPEDSFH